MHAFSSISSYIQGQCDTGLCDFKFYHFLAKPLCFSVLNTRTSNVLFKIQLLPPENISTSVQQFILQIYSKLFLLMFSGFTQLFPCLTLKCR